MNREIKILGILISSLLILIFGALLGIFFSINSTQEFILDEDYFDEDFDPDLFGDHYAYDILTLKQFSNVVRSDLETREDLLNFLESNEYEIYDEDEYFEAELDLGCEFNDIFEEVACRYHVITFFEEDDESYVEFLRIYEIEDEFEEEDDE